MHWMKYMDSSTREGEKESMCVLMLTGGATRGEIWGLRWEKSQD